MERSEILNRIKSLNLPKGSYIVFVSGILAALGIREVNDIDLFVSDEIYQRLNKEGWTKTHKGLNDDPLTHDVFEAHDNWNFSTYNPSFKELLSRAVEIDGVDFASLNDVRSWKTASRRPKDLLDIKLINGHLAKAFK